MDQENIIWVRLQRQCVTTKICNGILPTATTLKRWKQQKHDFCVLCGAQEATTHMLRCQHSSRQQWRRQTITKFHATMKALNTALHIQDLFCTALTHWFDNGVIPIEQFHDSCFVVTATNWMDSSLHGTLVCGMGIIA